MNETMAIFMRNQLVKLFEMLGMENAVNHLAERYASIGSCTDHEGDALKKRLEGSKKLAVGNVAPEIIGTTVDGKFFDASTIKADKTLLVFWASWCPHCKQEMPELKKVYEAQKPGIFEVVSVSIDTNSNELKSYLKEKQLPWTTLYDGKSWFGAMPVAYHLYATPIFYVLDKNRRIIGKGGSLEEVTEYLR
jgi:thiol-disulfide isomerase/thioredoxin